MENKKMLNCDGIEICQYLGEGFLPVTSFGAWRVAMMGFADRYTKEGMYRIERHTETDEVFVLLEGEAELCIAGEGETPDELKWIPMEKNMVYNVKKNVWHHISLKEGSHVLVVENIDTGTNNTEYFNLK